ncbi:MAG: porin family protein [Bacteroidota bacterium]
MKKIILLLTIAICCLQIAGHSQNKVGISAGVSVANMKGKVDGDSKTGIITGLVLETPLGKVFTFRPTLSYVQKGQNQPPPGLADKYYIALRYIEFSPDVLYYISDSKTGFFLGAGPSLAFGLPSTKVTVTDGVKTPGSIKFGKTVADDLRGMDYGADFTAGWSTKGGLFLSINYNRGFRNLGAEGAPGTLKNSYFGVQLGYFLNNGKPAK